MRYMKCAIFSPMIPGPVCPAPQVFECRPNLCRSAYSPSPCHHGWPSAPLATAGEVLARDLHEHGAIDLLLAGVLPDGRDEALSMAPADMTAAE